MPSRNGNGMKEIARQMLASISAEVWAIHEPAMATLLESLEHVAQTGETPSVDAATYRLPKAIADLPCAAFSSRVRVAGDTAVIPIVGTIRPRPDIITRWYGGTACSDLRSDLQLADADPNISRILLWCDSPGGSVAGICETGDTVYGIRQAGKTKIEAYVDGMNASACYWLSSAASRITALPESLTGSIGVILMHADWSRAFSEFGIDLTVITFGKHKGDASPYKPLGAQGKATLQELVDSTGKLFHAAVAKHREVSIDVVKSRFGEGKVFVGEEAKSRGLIDAVGSLQMGVAPPEEDKAVGQASLLVIDSGSTSRDAGPTPLTLTLSPRVGEGTGSQHKAAAVSAVSQSATSESAAPRNFVSGGTKENLKMNARIKAFLFAAGYVADVNAGDEVYQAALTALCAGAGITLSADTNEALKQLQGIGQTAPAAKATATATAPEAGGTARAQAARDQEIAEAREAGQKAYVERRDAIEGLAATINAGRAQPVIGADQIRTALDGKQSLAEIQASWKNLLTAETDDNRRLNPPITMGTSGEDLFATHAVDALMCRINPALVPESQRPKNGYGELRNMSLFQIAQRSMQLTNRGMDLTMLAKDQICSMALQMGGNSYGLGVGARVPYGMEGSSPAYNRPADFPNLMSNLMGKLLDRYMALAAPTYQHYSDRMPDTDDFKPSILVAVATFTTLDAVKDGAKYADLKIAEEVQGWIAVERFGNSIQLTPVMVANDNLDAIMQQVRTLAYAHENTMNTLNLELVTGNVKLPDSVALFHATHNNLVSAGGPPSATEAEKMKLIHQRQKGIGTDKTIRSTPKVVLVPPALETAAEQTYMPIHRLVESKMAQTDAALNVHRGRTVHTIAVEPDLEGYTNGTIKWWTFDDPSIHRVIAHQYMTGYGSGGRRTMWYDPASDCRFFALEGRMGVAAVGYRGAAQNAGTGA